MVKNVYKEKRKHVIHINANEIQIFIKKTEINFIELIILLISMNINKYTKITRN